MTSFVLRVWGVGTDGHRLHTDGQMSHAATQGGPCSTLGLKARFAFWVFFGSVDLGLSLTVPFSQKKELNYIEEKLLPQKERAEHSTSTGIKRICPAGSYPTACLRFRGKETVIQPIAGSHIVLQWKHCWERLRKRPWTDAFLLSF